MNPNKENVRRSVMVAFVLTTLVISISCRSNTGLVGTPFEDRCSSSAPVPAEEALIYERQREWLTEYRNAVDAHAPRARSQPIFGGHLLTADSNRASALLQPDAMKWAEISLDRFKHLGIQGVTLNLGYPMLLPWFPDSDRYLAYYREVARAVRKRGMTLAVEQIVLYTGSQFSPFKFKLSDLTLEEYMADQARMAQIIIDELAPDYLTVMHEPDTVAELTGLRSMLTPDVATTYLSTVLARLRRGRTLLGAGSGSWSSPLFADAFAKNTDVDYIDIHIYWINASSIANAYEMARSAEKHGKPVIVTEAGLYKSLGEGLEGVPLGEDLEETPNVEGVAAVYRRDVFSFWEPLDMEFLDVTVRFARSVDSQYISPYWTNMFFSYIDWTPETAGMSYRELNTQISARLTAQAWLNGRSTCVGRSYKALIDDAR
jgi:hypothetical protein